MGDWEEQEQLRARIEQEQEQLRARIEQEQLQERWRVLEELGQFERVKEEQEQLREQARRKELGLPEEPPRLPKPPEQKPQRPLTATELGIEVERLREDYAREMRVLEDLKKHAAQHGLPIDSRMTSTHEKNAQKRFEEKLLELLKGQEQI
ncbi:hypothetical protein AGMMS49975_01410 [Clostridia bacterium]|nr:hypothetical protein AGMMS49975_01410 [Clostridia bacterium]